MTKLPKTIENLFYNPETDSVDSLLKDIKETHLHILENTDLSKGTLSSKPEDYVYVIKDFKIPNNGIGQGSFDSIIPALFRGVSRWHSPRTMYNVAPPPILPTVVGKVFTSLYNPNLALDTAAGKSLLTEQEVIKAIADYIGWDRENAGGIFTWGGKATIMYGIKLGLKNCSPNSSTQGAKEDVVVLSTVAGHPSHIQDANWLGIGTDNVIRLEVDRDGKTDVNQMEQVIKKVTREGKKIAAIIVSGGTTNSMVVDPIEKVVELRNRLVNELSLKYIPHIHVDAVVAFPWIFFKDYNFGLNNLDIEAEALERILKIIKDLKCIYLADSFGIDFHKMGFCPYISSAFLVKDKTLLSGKEDLQNWPFLYSMENSRAGDGPNSAFIALSALGVKGFQVLIAHLTEMAVHLQNEIEKTGNFEIINKTGLGTSVMFIPRIPKGLTFPNLEIESKVRNFYTASFIEEMSKLGNPYYIDKIPGNSTGSSPFPLTSLKAYIMSPFSSKENNLSFVEFIVELKRKIDMKFDFHNTNIKSSDVEFFHPLKG